MVSDGKSVLMETAVSQHSLTIMKKILQNKYNLLKIHNTDYTTQEGSGTRSDGTPGEESSKQIKHMRQIF